MTTLSDRFDFPVPGDSDNPDIPEDLNDLVLRLEAVLAQHDDLWSAGDFKTSARAADHGRWLLCDGRALSAAEIVTALGLQAGQADALATLLGTGASSKYGSAAVGKIKLPDPRGRFEISAGAGAGLTARAIADQGGAETVQLTAAQSGLPGHNHSATQAAHNHGVTDGGHSHTDGTLATDTIANHTHGPGTLATDGEAGHFHTADGSLTAASPGAISRASGNPSADHSHNFTTGGRSAAHTHVVGSPSGQVYVFQAGGPGAGVVSIPSTAAFVNSIAETTDHTHSGSTGGVSSWHTHNTDIGSHTHDVTGNTSTDGAHSHLVDTGATAAGGSHSHDVTGSVASATTGISTQNATPAVTVAAVAAADAASAHANMPPYIALGNVFIRV